MNILCPWVWFRSLCECLFYSYISLLPPQKLGRIDVITQFDSYKHVLRVEVNIQIKRSLGSHKFMMDLIISSEIFDEWRPEVLRLIITLVNFPYLDQDPNCKEPMRIALDRDVIWDNCVMQNKIPNALGRELI